MEGLFVPILVVGSVAFDSVETPFAKARSCTWWSSLVFFSGSLVCMTTVNLVAVVGTDFPQQYLDFLRSRPINLELAYRLRKGRHSTGQVATTWI